MDVLAELELLKDFGKASPGWSTANGKELPPTRPSSPASRPSTRVLLPITKLARTWRFQMVSGSEDSILGITHLTIVQ
jgi:hypothetical protein